ncbi:unnamed protein product, partial [Coregonus sp. 'balchen']
MEGEQKGAETREARKREKREEESKQEEKKEAEAQEDCQRDGGGKQGRRERRRERNGMKSGKYFDAPTCKGGPPERPSEFFVTSVCSPSSTPWLPSALRLRPGESTGEKQGNTRREPLIDFGVTCVFTFMWLVSSAAWAKGLSDVKASTDPEKVVDLISACDEEGNLCREVHDPVMSGLNTSVCFGFMNLVLWGGNLWFVFKETGIIAPFMRAPPPQEKQPAPDSYGQQAGYEQGGYQPEYNQQQGYNQEGGEYGQAPTSFSNQ